MHQLSSGGRLLLAGVNAGVWFDRLLLTETTFKPTNYCSKAANCCIPALLLLPVSKEMNVPRSLSGSSPDTARYQPEE